MVEKMEINRIKAIIEAILFSCGRPVEIKELITAIELPEEDIIKIIESMKSDWVEANRGTEIIKVGNGYTLCSKKSITTTYIHYLIIEQNLIFQMQQWKHLQ